MDTRQIRDGRSLGISVLSPTQIETAVMLSVQWAADNKFYPANAGA